VEEWKKNEKTQVLGFASKPDNHLEALARARAPAKLLHLLPRSAKAQSVLHRQTD